MKQDHHLLLSHAGLLTNCIILDNTLEISAALNALAGEGYRPSRHDTWSALATMRSIFRQCLREVADDLTFQLEPPAPPEVVEAGQENWIPDEQALSKRNNSCQVLWRELLPPQ